jgi:glycosyltransferase involved in cell wall biosynthesis
MNEFPKVAHVMRRFTLQKWGGTESVVHNLAREYIRTGMESPIFCTDMFAKAGIEMVDGVPVNRFPYVFPWLFLSEDAKAKLRLKGGSPWSPALMRTLAREPGLSLIHAHAQHRLGGIARTVARRRGIPYVVSIHGGHMTLPTEQIEKMRDPFRGKPEWGKLVGLLLGARRTLDDASAIICVGRDENEAMLKKYPGKSHYVPNGVRTALFREASPEVFRRHVGFGPEVPYMVCISRIDYQKNQLLLVRAFARFAAAHPAWRLVLIGPVTVEAYGREIEEAIRAAGLADRVTMIPGFAPDDPRLPSAYKGASAFVLPTVHEPFGIVILEAWAAGTPVIASRVGGIPGFTHDGSDALLFEKNDEDGLFDRLTRVADNEALRRDLAAAGAREVAAYDWSSIARRMLDIYAEAARRHRGGG